MTQIKTATHFPHFANFVTHKKKKRYGKSSTDGFIRIYNYQILCLICV